MNAQFNARNNNLQNNRGNNIVLSIVFFIVIIISIFNIYNFIFTINSIKKYFNLLPQNVFEECYLYQKYYDLFMQFLSFFMGIDIILLTIIPLIDVLFDSIPFHSKFDESFFYYNYLIFGPFILGFLLLSIKYRNKLIYTCIHLDPAKKMVNYRFSSGFLFFISLSSIITLLGIFYFESKFFANSIKYKQSGNYIIGKIFWAYAFKHSPFLRNRVNRNNLHEEILNNVENNIAENQNI